MKTVFYLSCILLFLKRVSHFQARLQHRFTLKGIFCLFVWILVLLSWKNQKHQLQPNKATSQTKSLSCWPSHDPLLILGWILLHHGVALWLPTALGLWEATKGSGRQRSWVSTTALGLAPMRDARTLGCAVELSHNTETGLWALGKTGCISLLCSSIRDPAESSLTDSNSQNPQVSHEESVLFCLRVQLSEP